MASGLLKLNSSLSAKLISCIKSSAFHSTNLNTGCRTVMSIAFNSGFADESFSLDKNQKQVKKHHEVVSLKEKERGDWRHLTLEEKQTLYSMSFSQPFSEVIDEHDDDWKIILASAFTAMGIMTLGLYFWMVRKAESTELFNGPISLQAHVTEEDKMNICQMKQKEKESSIEK